MKQNNFLYVQMSCMNKLMKSQDHLIKLNYIFERKKVFFVKHDWHTEGLGNSLV